MTKMTSFDHLPLFQPSGSTSITKKMVKGVADYLDGKTDKNMRCNTVARIFQNIHAVLKQHEG